MSFILDALRKSESERRRETPPQLSRAPLAPVRDRVPLWAWLLIGLMLVALIALAAAWWRGRFDDAASPARLEGPAAAGEAANVEARAAPQQQRDPAADPPRLRPISEIGSFDASLPAYRLEVLACCTQDPSRDSAWINGRRYFAGERIGNGPVVVELRPDGVVLAFGGERFLLTPRD